MKFLFVSALLLSTAFAAPSSSLRFTKRETCSPSSNPSPGAVQNAIAHWLSDVQTVNSFLDSHPAVGSVALQQAAQSTLARANDEPVELGVLASICELETGDAAYSQAVLLLMEVFGNVPASLQSIVDNFGNAALVNGALNTINSARCCNVLPALDVLWETAAEDFGLVGTVNTAVPRPRACSTIQC